METGTVIHVAADGAYLGYIVISDEPKTGSREAVARLRADGVRVVMLTGDPEERGRRRGGGAGHRGGAQ